MTPLKFRLECENCGIWLIVTYDADVPTKVLRFACACGHSTPVIQVPGPNGWQPASAPETRPAPEESILKAFERSPRRVPDETLDRSKPCMHVNQRQGQTGPPYCADCGAQV